MYFYIKITSLIWLIANVVSFAQLPGNFGGSDSRIAIAGDSWAQFMADDDSHNTMLKMYGQADKIAVSSTYEICLGCIGSPGSNDYAVSGSEARQWVDEVNYDYLQNLIDALNADTEIDWVVLSIGGNDILASRSDGGWYKNMDLDVAGSEAALFAVVQANTQYIMDQVWARARPSINFMISGYDFPNFNVNPLWCGFYACEKREDLSRDDNSNGSIDASELITDVEISAMMESVELIRKGMANSNPKIFYDNAMGLMHHYYGYDDGLYSSFLPGTTSAPQGSLPYTSGGDPNTPTDRDNFRSVGLFGLIGAFDADPIHLDFEGYEYKIKHQMDNILFEGFRQNNSDNMTTVWSTGSQDGYVDVIDNMTNGSGIRVGDDGSFCCSGAADNEYRGILSFNTSSLPDNAQVTGASLYMIKSSEDDNPFLHNDRNPVLDIKNGHFGSSVNLEVADGTSAANASNIGTFHGTGENNKDAIRVDINSTGLAHINKTGTTQLRFYFDYSDWSVEYINFYDGGGIAASLPPDVVAAQYEPKYAYRVVKKTENPDGSFTEEEIEKGEEVQPREGYVLQEKLKEVREDEEGNVLEFYFLYQPLEHSGLAKHMSDAYGAPANGLAPFLDISYILILPVELVDFQAVKKEKAALLNWTTATEINSNGFFIQHSTDKKKWEKLDFISSDGNSETIRDYEYSHENPVYGNNYYRLKMEDIDGTIEYSEVRVLNFRNGAAIINVFPNPFKEELSFEADFETAGIAKIQIVDMLGKIVFSQQIEVETGLQNYSLDDLSILGKGNYILQIIHENEVFLGKVVRN